MTSRGNVLRGVALAIGTVLFLAGCEDSASPVATTTGAASTTSTAAATKSADPDAALWNPCDLPESAISATRLDPASKKKDVAGVDFDGWKVCSWRASARWYELAIYSGTPTLNDFKKRRDFEAFTPRTIGSRQAVDFLRVGDTKRLTCGTAIEVPQGTVSFEVSTRYEIGKQGEPCVEARRHIDDLVRYLPGS
ncbi:DUF3558 domain-containing protein [Nocardia sp. NBC_01009]|uniref:DUF3558 domain-containing protein n=1 Tax=Nocardia sp. NBC_01009 TaxID=2975996 RepID=UPI003870DDBC|nr:DUF3558 domain-containing protein [Nocardia sp. NBC_01009]